MYIVIAIKFISKKNVKNQSPNCAERNKVKKLGKGIKFRVYIFIGTSKAQFGYKINHFVVSRYFY